MDISGHAFCITTNINITSLRNDAPKLGSLRRLHKNGEKGANIMFFQQNMIEQ